MFELFGKRLNQIAKGIEKIFIDLDNQAVASIDVYSKANATLAKKIDELYVTLQICSDICSQYLLDHEIDLISLERIPDEYRKILEKDIEFHWKPFQNKVKQTLTKYSNYLTKLNQDKVNELQGVIEMTTKDVLDIYDSTLKEDPERMNNE